MWTLPILILVAAIAVSIPLSRYMAWIMDGRYRAPRFLRWFESRLDSGPQDWKQYTVALLVFNVVLFVFGFVVLCLQPLMPLNPLGRGMLAPSTIFNTVISFMTNTNLQHYSGDQHFSNFTQIFFILPNMFLSASVGLCALSAIIRALRGEHLVGNFFIDMWRAVVYMFLPIALIVGVIFIQHDDLPVRTRAHVRTNACPVEARRSDLQRDAVEDDRPDLLGSLLGRAQAQSRVHRAFGCAQL